MYFKSKFAVLCLMPERTRHHFQQVREKDLLRLNRNCSRFNLREIENVADQVQQVSSGTVNRAGKFDLLWGEVMVRVLTELLAQDENRIQRSPQLVGHVREELRLVFRGKGEFLGLLFEGPTRLFDFLIFAFNFDVLL